MAKKKIQPKETLVDILEAKEQAQDFLDKYKWFIVGAGFLLLLVVLGPIVNKHMFKMPKEKEAIEQMYKAEYQFKIDSFAQALTNPGGGYPGFLDIAEEYKGTEAGNLANYYAGISYLHLGEYAAAIDFLNAFKAGGKITPATKTGAIGDAYSELGEFDKALEYYQKAASTSENDFTTPYYLMKAGMLLERMGKPAEALVNYEKIQKEYPNSQQGGLVEKYIARLSPGT